MSDMEVAHSASESETSSSTSPSASVVPGGATGGFLSQIPTTSGDRHNLGTTSVIRQRLNFNDETVWKRFSSRRLQLVEHLSLSSKKASEQDEEISGCAYTLMKEFNYPDHTLNDFDKLVRLAIQSARRNKKRSEKRLASKALDKSYYVDRPKSNGTSEATNGSNTTATNTAAATKTTTGEWQEVKQGYLPSKSTGKFLLGKAVDIKIESNTEIQYNNNEPNTYKRAKLNLINSDNTDRLKFLSDITILEDEAERKSYSKHIDIGENSESASTLAMHSLLSPMTNGSAHKEKKPFADTKVGNGKNNASSYFNNGVVSNNNKFNDQVGKSNVELPSISQLNIRDYEDLFNDFALATSSILNCIKKSKTCFDITNSSQRPSISDTPNNEGLTTFSNYEGVELLGNSCILAAICMTLERWFDDLSPASTSYIRMKLNGHTMLSSVLKSLDKSSFEVNRLSEYVAAQLLKKLVGSCVKDFGFNEAMYPLCDIFHYYIMKEYPLITNRLATGERKKDILPSMMSLSTNRRQSVIVPQSNTSSTNDSAQPLFQDDNLKSILDSTILRTSVTQNISQTSNLTQYNPSHNFLSLQPVLPMLNPYRSEWSSFGLTQNGSALHSTSNVVFNNSSSLIPQSSSSHITSSNGSISVILKFNNRELKFAYSPHSSAPPTMLELITNGKSAFHIMDSDRTLQIRNLENWKVIQSDYELEKLFKVRRQIPSNDNSTGPSSNERIIGLELFYPESNGNLISSKGDTSTSTATATTSGIMLPRPNLSATNSYGGSQSSQAQQSFFKFQPLL